MSLIEVFIVWDDSWDDIRKVFKKEKDAKKFIKGKDYLYIEKWEVS